MSLDGAREFDEDKENERRRVGLDAELRTTRRRAGWLILLVLLWAVSAVAVGTVLAWVVP